MALTQTDLDALDAAIASSELEVQTSDGRRVRFGTAEDLIARRAHVAQVLTGTAAAGNTRRSFSYRMTTSRGD